MRDFDDVFLQFIPLLGNLRELNCTGYGDRGTNWEMPIDVVASDAPLECHFAGTFLDS